MMGLTELLRRIGDDHVVLEPVESNIQGAKVVRGAKHLTEIALLTTQTNPSQIMGLASGQRLPKIGIVIWFPRERYEQALADHAAGVAIPASPGGPR